ncbi:MAG: hypothetical protein HFI89_10930 [Lachnospiraceae bacterium]|jgi:predicted membrane channel-forming protein YqfA (hemolysin III family)|nr:hypothetical protein [Lachnospiraceae bacterium]
MGNAGLEHENRENNGNQENDEHKEFLSLGAGAILALILLAVFLTATGIQVQGWIRFAVIPVYVLLLCLCSWVVDRLMGRKGNKDKEN